MYPSDRKILNEITLSKNLSSETIRSYEYIITNYTNCHNLSLQQLLDEAEEEENNNIPLRNRKIKQRLIQFKQYLINKNFAVATINLNLMKIKSIYYFYDFELPHNITPLKNNIYKTIEDIPTMEDVKLAIENTNNIRLQAIILFAVSSGCARREILNLTINDFISATKDYHHSNNIYDVINQLMYRDDVIPLFSILRQKTNKPYYCCCSNEAVKKICVMLKERSNTQKLNANDTLFNISKSNVSLLFANLNDKLNFGFVNNARYFRIHSLRMRFQTELAKAQIDNNYYEHMVGHKLNSIQESYIQIDPETVRKLYKKVVNLFCVYQKVNFIDITSDDKKELIHLREELRKIQRKLTENGY